MRKLLDDESWENQVARYRFAYKAPASRQLRILKWNILIVCEQHHANGQEQCKLKQHHKTAEDERLLALAFVSARQQSLHEQLIGAVRSHCQERAAKESGP